MHSSSLDGAATQIEAYSINRFCNAFSVGRTYVYAQIKTKKLRAVKRGARTVILRHDAEAWANALPTLATSNNGA